MIESHGIILYETQPVILKLERYHRRKKNKKLNKHLLRVPWKLPSTVRFLFLSSGPISITTDDYNNEYKTNSVCNSVSWQYQCICICIHRSTVFLFFRASLQSKCRDHNLNVTQVFRSVLCFDTSNKFVISGCTWFSVLFGFFLSQHFKSLIL